MIQTILTVKENEKIDNKVLTDNRGILLDVGKKVAYNFSGTIAVGKIIEIKKNCYIREGSTTYSNISYTIYRLDFLVIVENENGEISKIRNPNSLIIIA